MPGWVIAALVIAGLVLAGLLVTWYVAVGYVVMMLMYAYIRDSDEDACINALFWAAAWGIMLPWLGVKTWIAVQSGSPTEPMPEGPSK